MTADILHFDPDPSALIHPRGNYNGRRCPKHAVLCYCHEIVHRIGARSSSRIVRRLRTEMGDLPIYRVRLAGQALILVQPGVGGPLAATCLENVIAMGCTQIIACGGAGVLNGETTPGEFIVPDRAVRDEGTSYHYLPPDAQAKPCPAAARALISTLTAAGEPFHVGSTWTTDAFYRETPGKIRMRREAGCLSVEMEAASLMAVAQFRGVQLACLFYAADDVSGTHWNQRIWKSGDGHVRQRMLKHAVKACFSMEDKP